MQDRVPASGQTGRVKITPEGGGTAFYAKLEMADNPSVEGTPLNKANLLTDSVAAELGLSSANATPNNALSALHSLVSVAQSTAEGRATVVTGSYVGTGTYGYYESTSLTFQFQPKLVVLLDAVDVFVHLTLIIPGVLSYGLTTEGSTSLSTLGYIVNACATHRMPTTLNQNTVSWYSGVSALAQMNKAGETYYYVAIG